MATVERPYRRALSHAIDIYRDEMRPFIVCGFERVYDSTAGSEIREALPGHLAEIYEEVLQEGGDLESAIDVNSFPLLVQRRWKEVFAAYFRGKRTIQNELWQIAKARDYVCHPWTQDLSAEYTRARLFDIAETLSRINAPDQKRAVENIRAQLFVPAPVTTSAEATAVPGKAKGYTTVPGYENPNSQRNIGRVQPWRKSPITGHFMYRMKCLECNGEYNRWAGDISQCKCPYCGGGIAGLDPSEGVIVG